MELELKQRQSLILSAALQQAFIVLQMPHLELAQWLKVQIEQNPLLEYRESKGKVVTSPEVSEVNFDDQNFTVLDSMDESFKTSVFPDWAEEQTPSSPPQDVSLYEHLMQQAQLCFETREELVKAQEIIGNLDERGFLGDFPADPLILAKIQTFDPPGVAARNLQQSLLLQLPRGSHSFVLIRDHFDDLLHRRFAQLAKKMRCSLPFLEEMLRKEVSKLNFSPGSRFRTSIAPPLVPDVVLKKDGDKWVVEICENHLPRFDLISPPETVEKGEKSYIRRHIAEGKWLLRMIRRRHNTLRAIVLFLLKTQTEFFGGNLKKLVPLTMREAAAALSIHESTVARAVSDKYLSCPLGIFSMRSFFSHTITTTSGKKISNSTVRRLIAELIEKEDKQAPLSDQEIGDEIQKLGIPCARRTVAKHRQTLRLEPAQLRKSLGSAERSASSSR